jgi:hypothetical protein
MLPLRWIGSHPSTADVVCFGLLVSIRLAERLVGRCTTCAILYLMGGDRSGSTVSFARSDSVSIDTPPGSDTRLLTRMFASSSFANGQTRQYGQDRINEDRPTRPATLGSGLITPLPGLPDRDEEANPA